jgi:CheY-like chemotaxis protein
MFFHVGFFFGPSATHQDRQDHKSREIRPWQERIKAMVDTNILLVDDDQDTCASLSDIFLDLGYTVDMANDGPGALQLSGGHHYRLALLDYNMPGMDGLELCRRLKLSQPSVVVALITAFSSIATMGAATEAGVRCSLLKPVNFSVLMPLVEEVVNGRVDNIPVQIGTAVA